MKKLVLNVEALEVETFSVNASGEKPGTVAAHEATFPCISLGCPPTSNPHDIYCVFQSADASFAGNCNCTPVCYTYQSCPSEEIC